MPMHDWTKVDAGTFHDFHNVWLVGIRHALNHGVLPPGYYAQTARRAAEVEADVLALHPVAAEPAALPTGAEPTVAVLQRAEPAVRPPGRRLLVRDGRHAVVAVIEVVSPGNTKDRENHAAFVEKAADLLAAGVHFVFVNPFAPPRHAPAGLHAAIWRRVTRLRKSQPPTTPPPGRPLVAASYCSSAARVTAAVQPFAVGEPLPEVPLYLSADEAFVSLPLEPTYAAAFAEVPPPYRAELER